MFRYGTKSARHRFSGGSLELSVEPLQLSLLASIRHTVCDRVLMPTTNALKPNSIQCLSSFTSMSSIHSGGACMAVIAELGRPTSE